MGHNDDFCKYDEESNKFNEIETLFEQDDTCRFSTPDTKIGIGIQDNQGLEEVLFSYESPLKSP